MDDRGGSYWQIPETVRTFNGNGKRERSNGWNTFYVEVSVDNENGNIPGKTDKKFDRAPGNAKKERNVFRS